MVLLKEMYLKSLMNETKTRIAMTFLLLMALQIKNIPDTDKRVAPPYTVCLLIWVAKLEAYHVLQRTKTNAIGVAAIAYQCPVRLCVC